VIVRRQQVQSPEHPGRLTTTVEGNSLVKRSNKALVTLVGVGLLASFAATGIAQADPTGAPAQRVLSGQGSDTTQDVVNGLSNVITAGANQYFSAGYLHDSIVAGATSINTSWDPSGVGTGVGAAGKQFFLEDASQSGTIQASPVSTSTTLYVNFVPLVGDVLTTGAGAATVTAVAGSSVSGTTVIAAVTVSGLASAPAAGSAVTGHVKEGPFTVVSETPAVASTGVGNIATPYNVVTFTGATAGAHQKGALVIGPAIAAGTLPVASYDAQGAAFQSKTSNNCKFIANNATGGTYTGTTQNGVAGTGANSTFLAGARANGSGSGAKAVGDALDSTSGTWACTDFARASSSQTIPNAGTLGSANIPFALDGMTPAVTTSSNFPRALTYQNLLDAYACTGSFGGVPMIPTTTAASAITAAGGVQKYAAANGFLYATLPQLGSGTRNFIIDALGLPAAWKTSDATLLACITDTTPTGTVLEEHDLRTIDDNGLALVSIAQSITQRIQSVSGVSDKQGRTLLAALDNRTGTTNMDAGASNGNLNYPITMAINYGGAASSATKGRLWRNVFNVVPINQLGNPNVQAAFVGASSAFCTNNATIALYGFAPNVNCGIPTLK